MNVVSDNDLAQAFADNEEMRQVQSYLTRGRELAQLSDDDAADQWVRTFAIWFGKRGDARSLPLVTANDDAAAELLLRNIPQPHGRVAELLRVLQRESDRIAQNIGGVRPPTRLAKRFRAFLDEMATGTRQ
jgi:hypothetical protein